MSSNVRRLTEDAVGIDAVGEFGEVHIPEGQIILNAPCFARDDTECFAGFTRSVNNKDGPLGICERHLIHNAHAAVVPSQWS